MLVRNIRDDTPGYELVFNCFFPSHVAGFTQFTDDNDAVKICLCGEADRLVPSVLA